MVNQDKGKAEQFVLRGNSDSVMRQLVDEYNSSNGWQVNRIVNNILNFTVVLERNTKQYKEPEKVSPAKVAKVVETTDATQELAESVSESVSESVYESVSVQIAKDESEEAVESVKVNVKPVRKAKPQS